jgi:hypothetical protein
VKPLRCRQIKLVTKVNEDDLRKLGLRVRPRTQPTVEDDKPGRISFDELGNAVYQWNDQQLEQDGEDGERARRRALAHPGLTVVDEDPNPNAPIRNNPKGLRIGYNPYESGLLAKKDWKRKRDLRELSKWIETKKKVGGTEE